MYMSLFCLLWMPLFYLFWRSISSNTNLLAGVIAVLAGCAAVLIQYFVGNFIDPGEFGFERWLSGCVDIVVLPALIPFVVYILLIIFKVIPEPFEFAHFAQLWLIPATVVRAFTWSSQNDPIILILVPVLWTGISIGLPFFINLILNCKKWVIFPCSLGILIVPFAAASSYWAFFAHKSNLGFLFLLAAIAPMIVSTVLQLNKN